MNRNFTSLGSRFYSPKLDERSRARRGLQTAIKCYVCLNLGKNFTCAYKSISFPEPSLPFSKVLKSRVTSLYVVSTDEGLKSSRNTLPKYTSLTENKTFYRLYHLTTFTKFLNMFTIHLPKLHIANVKTWYDNIIIQCIYLY